VITPNVVTGLGLQPSGKVTVQGVGQAGTPAQHLCNTYLVNIYLPNNVVIVGVRASENSLADCDVLIGMDIIGIGDFAITNHNGKTTWTFRTPPCEEIDFDREIEQYKRQYGGWTPPSLLTNSASSKISKKPSAERIVSLLLQATSAFILTVPVFVPATGYIPPPATPRKPTRQ
jgi:hypothetical protein